MNKQWRKHHKLTTHLHNICTKIFSWFLLKLIFFSKKISFFSHLVSTCNKYKNLTKDVQLNEDEKKNKIVKAFHQTLKFTENEVFNVNTEYGVVLDADAEEDLGMKRRFETNSRPITIPNLSTYSIKNVFSIKIKNKVSSLSLHFRRQTKT